MFKTLSRLVSVLALAAPLAANATLFDFTATLQGSNELPGNLSAATGFAALQYNDGGTVGLLGDDSFFVLIGASGLTGIPSGWHIHGAATTTENGPVRVNVGGVLGGTAGVGTLVSGGLISALSLPALFSVPVTAPTIAPPGSNAGHPAMSFLSMLQSHLAYVNVHTPIFPGGEVRGQLLQVTVVPEPETYGMLLAGLALIGSVVVRRRYKT